MTALLATSGLGKRYRGAWALRDCTLTVPEQSIVGIAGSNGAGKSTLLGLAVGLLDPSEGSVAIRRTRRDAAALADVGYVAQGAPLYRGFTVGDMLDFARVTNARWDSALARQLSRARRRRRASRRSRRASERNSRWRSPSASAPRCSCSTSRWRGSTPWRAATFCGS